MIAHVVQVARRVRLGIELQFVGQPRPLSPRAFQPNAEIFEVTRAMVKCDRSPLQNSRFRIPR
jgi:hypothetical protein